MTDININGDKENVEVDITENISDDIYINGKLKINPDAIKNNDTEVDKGKIEISINKRF